MSENRELDIHIDGLTIKLMSLAVHIEEYFEETEKPMPDANALMFDMEAIRGLLADPEVAAVRLEMDGMALLPLKREEQDDG